MPPEEHGDWVLTNDVEDKANEVNGGIGCRVGMSAPLELSSTLLLTYACLRELSSTSELKCNATRKAVTGEGLRVRDLPVGGCRTSS